MLKFTVVPPAVIVSAEAFGGVDEPSTSAAMPVVRMRDLVTTFISDRACRPLRFDAGNQLFLTHCERCAIAREHTEPCQMVMFASLKMSRFDRSRSDSEFESGRDCARESHVPEYCHRCHSYRDIPRWLPHQDSNLDKVSQSHLCYRYTMRQSRAAETRHAATEVKQIFEIATFRAGW